MISKIVIPHYIVPSLDTVSVKMNYFVNYIIIEKSVSQTHIMYSFYPFLPKILGMDF